MNHFYEIAGFVFPRSGFDSPDVSINNDINDEREG